MAKFTIKQIMTDHWDNFYSQTPNVRPVVNKEVLKMINCQNPILGHALYLCEHCGKFKCVPFTCKSRFCNCCGIKYQHQRALALSTKLINCKHHDKLIKRVKQSTINIRKKLSKWRESIELSFGYDPIKCSCGNFMSFFNIYCKKDIAYSSA